MVLNALKHRARVVSGRRSAEFRCYLGLVDPAAESTGNGRLQAAERVNLILWPLAIDGTDVEVGVADELEISTGEETARWKVRGKPLAVSKHGRRRAVVTTVERVSET